MAKKGTAKKISTVQKPRRVLLKLSGEVLAGGRDGGIDRDALVRLAKEVREVVRARIEVCMVIGGGNFWRARDQAALGLDRVLSDNMGMLATVMNALAMRDMLRQIGVDAIAMSALPVPSVLDTYTPRAARAACGAGKVVICAGGTGNPFFTTDSAAALRALELGCDVLLKATNVDYVYDKDPKKHKDAKHFTRLSFQDVLARGLGVMDLAAVSLCMEGKLPIVVFNLQKHGLLLRAVAGEAVGTRIA